MSAVTAQDVRVMIKEALSGGRGNGRGKGRGRGGRGNNRAPSQGRGRSRGNNNNNNNKINNNVVSKLQQQLSQFKKRLAQLEVAKPPVPFPIYEVTKDVYTYMKDKTIGKGKLVVILEDAEGKNPRPFTSKDPAKGILYDEERSYYETVGGETFHKKKAKLAAKAEA